MIKTESAAIELTATVWKIKAETGQEKDVILEDLGFDPLTFDCPCCDYVGEQGYDVGYYSGDSCVCNNVCPLKSLWPAGGCMDKGSLYREFVFIYDGEEEQRISLKIAKFAGELAGTWWEP